MRPATAAVLLGAMLVAPACRTERSLFYDKTYPCASALGNGQCGTDVDGKPMACFAASQLGAQDFCAPSCPGGESYSTDEMLCLDSQVALERCQPSMDLGPEARACSDPTLRCLRTSLLEDRGVCTTTPVCAVDSNCHDSARSMCAATILKQLYPHAPNLHLDHVPCIKYGCHSRGSSCPPSELCLPDVIPAQSHPPDLCASQCDAHYNCPPNFVCYTRVSGPASPPVCIPGVLTFKCTSNIDCMIGDCIDTQAGFNVCTIPCTSNADCTPYDSGRGNGVCSFTSPSGTKYCMTAEAFEGANCQRDLECGAGTVCTLYSPYHTSLAQGGYCLAPCQSDGTCVRRGGLAHSCLSFLDRPVCYPGVFGLYCKTDDECLEDMTCHPVQEMTADDELQPTTACTRPCTTDDDCRQNRNTSNGWCDEGGFCLMPRPGGRLCTRDPQCATGVCALSELLSDFGKGISRCTMVPGGAP